MAERPPVAESGEGIDPVQAWAAAMGLAVRASDLPVLARTHRELRAQAELARGRLSPSHEPAPLDLRAALAG